MAAACRNSRRITGILAACALAQTILFNQQAHAKDKSLKGELEHSLVGQVVTARILLGDTARWSEEGQSAVLPVHTVVEAETGGTSYEIEWKFLGPEIVRTGDMQRYFATGTSFRITGIHLKGNRIEIKLKELSGRSTEVKLLLGEGWQSKYDAASVQARLARVFAFEGPGQQEVEARQGPPQAEPNTPVAPTTALEAPANPPPVSGGNWQRFSRGDTTGTPANQAPVPANSAVNPEQSEPASQPSMRSAYVNCNALKQLELYPTPALSPSPVVVLPCGEKVWAMGEQGGWAKVWTRQDVEGHALECYLTYGEPPSLEQSSAEQPGGPDGQPDTSAAPVTPSQSVESNQPVAQPPTEPASQPPYSSELPSRFALTLGYLIFAMISIMVALASRRSSRADVRLGPRRRRDAADSASADGEETTSMPGANGGVLADPYNEAACYLTGCGKKQNPRKAWSLLSASARAGKKEAETVLAAAGVARFPKANTARLDRGSPALTILLAVVLTAIGCGIVAALMGCLDLWKTL